ncbi:MAG: antibiotic biosynthesis monooxygenase [Pseudomonadota bacterium]
MAVTVLIKRKLAPGNEDRLKSLYQEMNEAALKRDGYLGSEILRRVDVDNQMLVISRWKHVDEWTQWLVSSERRVLQEQIDVITSAETKFEIYDE